MNFQIFLISIDNKDPTEEFLKRFKNIPRQVTSGSAGYLKKEPFPGWLHDKTTGQKAIRFNAGAISWKSRSSVEVNAEYYCGGLCAAGYIFRLQFEKGQWIVREVQQKWIS